MVVVIYRHAVALGDRNGNPPQCSCLENPMDRGPRNLVFPCSVIGFSVHSFIH